MWRFNTTVGDITLYVEEYVTALYVDIYLRRKRNTI
jgi:hypothetical protein